MSVQLILFPQTFNGQSPPIAAPTEYVANGNQWNALQNAVSNVSNVTYNTSNIAQIEQDVINNFPPTIPNQWYRFKTNPSSSYPLGTTISTGRAIEFSGASGVYQKMTNIPFPSLLKPTYVGFNLNTAGKIIRIRIFDTNGNQVNLYQQFAGVSPTTLAGFVNTSHSELIIMISFHDTKTTSATSASLNSVSITQVGEPEKFDLSDGQVICDLYEDEDIPLTLSVDDFKNSAEQIQSYSKAFMLPGTKRNNKIFANLFEVTRSNAVNTPVTFNAYALTQCIVKQDGFLLFQGYLKIIDIQEKEGEISYNVNLYSEATTLADVLKERTFNDINLDELEHTYDKDTIKGSWNTNGLTLTNNLSPGSFAGTAGTNVTDVLKYPFCDWEHTFLIADGTTGNFSTVDMPELTTLQQAFRPFIKVKYLIDRIFEPINFDYESDFFESSDFKKLFMDFNWGADNAPNVFNLTRQANTQEESVAANTLTKINWEWGGSPSVPDITSEFGWDSTNRYFEATSDSQEYVIACDTEFIDLTVASNVSVDVRWVRTKVSGQKTIFQTQQIPPNNLGGAIYQTNFTIVLMKNETLHCEFRFNNSSGKVALQIGLPILSPPLTVTTSATEVTSNNLLQALRGEIKQWDFLRGIMTMFNLVTIPNKDNPKILRIEPYKDVFLPSITGVDNYFDNNSSKLSWNNKVDITEIKLEPLTDLEKIIKFNFAEDDDDYAFNRYKQSVQGFSYGSAEFNAEITEGGLPTVYSGVKEIVAEPFAATVIKPLMSQYPEFIIPSIYSYNAEDSTSSGFDNSPRILYNNGIKNLQGTYYIPEQNLKSSENQSQFLQFSHLTDIPTITSSPPLISDTKDFNFGVCQLLIGNSNPTVNNLLNVYWLPYLNELYNADTRTMTIKVALTASDINTFDFIDTVMIKNREYRVNRIDYKPNDLSTVEFILLI